MGKVIVINHVTLDGVMQGPGRPDEDRRGGFEHGGWAVAGNDEVMGAKLADGMAKQTGALLLGRRTYENFYAYWPRQPRQPVHRPPQQDDQVRGVAHANRAAAVVELDPARRRRRRCGRGAQAASYRGSDDHGQRRADRIAYGRRPGRRAPPDDPPARARHRTPTVRGRGRTRCCGSSKASPRRQEW